MMVLIKCLSNFRKALEMHLINCEISLILTLSEECRLSNDTKATTIAITDIKFYVPVVTLSIQDNAKLLLQLKSSFKIKINWKKSQSKLSVQVPKPFLDYSIGPRFQESK